MPAEAKASFLSSLLGLDASASTNIADPNSQNMNLLQANVSSTDIIQEKDNKKDIIDSKKDVNIVADNALLPNANPIAPDGIDIGDDISEEISVYVVRKGDSLAQIAEMFDVSTNTILWANDMKKGDKLVEGDVLLILPVSGVKHTVLKGQTLKGIAKKYDVDVSDIAGLNGIAEDAQLAVGDELIVPDGEVADNSNASDKKDTKPNTKNKTPTKKYTGKDLDGYFTNPLPQYVRRSQGLHGKNGVDLAAPTGTPIVAAATGKILLARMGYNGGYGNMVIMQHPNGTKTLYGHMSRLGTSTGATVSKGEVIGYVGSTGHSTGPHLHFEVSGARNPTASLSKR